MADFKAGVLTDLGKALAAKVEAGKCKLQFTKMKVGDGSPSCTEPMTDLASPKKMLDLSAVTPNDKGTCDVEAVMTNADLDKGFYLREIGLFATDPDVGEILYCVATAGDADYIQAKGGATVLSVAIHMTIAINSVDDVVTDVDIKGLVTAADLKAHDASETAHENLLMVTSTADKPASMSDRGLWVEIKDGLKSILHRWNKTTKSYDTLHPETESAQITDWHSGIMASLASKTLGTVVDAITTDSVLGKLIKLLLNASGVKYLIDTNGYICFGEFFGGLIIQWGTAPRVASNTAHAMFPISFNSSDYILIATGHIDDNSTAFIGGVLYNHKVNDSCLLRGSEANGPAAEYIAIGK
ncbi:gp53-like domain-containing protein [Dialister hominis]|uniref:gp53-like domain-containing protein n=1 Tax=Dialister hominis TaxID=2582419 RepID=UPI0035209E40